MMCIRGANDNILHVGWLKGMRQIWIPWDKKWYVILDNSRCKHISKDGCSIYNDNTRPIICGTFLCQKPVATYKKLIPILERASKRILYRKFKHWKRPRGEAIRMESKKIIIGCGSGRCGTCSLAALLNAQFETCVTHEEGTPLPWNSIDRHYNINRDLILNYPQRVVGDVSFWWLRYVGDLVNDFPNIRIVCMKRDKESTVNSLLKCSNIFNANHYTSEFSKYYDFEKYPLDKPDSVVMRSCFPKYDYPIKEAMEAYWEEYYNIAMALETSLANNFRVFDIDVLNSNEGIIDLLTWCGFKYPIVLQLNLQKELTL